MNHFIQVSLDSLFYQLSVGRKFDVWVLNLTFDQPLFIFNPNLGIELSDQLVLKYKLQFDNLGLFGIL